MNRLSDSPSLYLRQHADNPVHWHPWDEIALESARESGRPILLSIGYSACHWCHVMAHESFEHEATAEVMNELFTNIKVDREERPDLDKVYQLAHQLLTGRGGGWPLTVFLEPDTLTPFFAGTYFPPAPRHGMPAFTEVLSRIRAWYDGNREEVSRLQDGVAQAIAAIQEPDDSGLAPQPGLLHAAAARALDLADLDHGGFGGAPKFPQAPLLAAVNLLARQPGGEDLAHHERFTLMQMATGGLRDHLDGGFFRYTVDGDWTIPHFEKMLYDNALLLPLYAEAAARLQDDWLTEVSTGIADWLEQEMRQSNGGFSSSMDADADGKEGGFHVWGRDEVAASLEADELAVAVEAFALDSPPNFEGHAWHLTRRRASETGPVLASAIEKLRNVRARRVAPATDHKQLASWNALCAEGLARAGMALQRNDWLDLAEAGLGFINQHLWHKGRLYTMFAEDRAYQPGFLDDYAFLLKAELALLEARWNDQRLESARRLADGLIEQFGRPGQDGFYFTANGSDAPLHRLRILQDDATPSGNGIAAQALLQLGHLVAESRYLEAAEGLLCSAEPELRKYPLGHASLLVALDTWFNPPGQVIVTGPDAPETQAWAEAVRRPGRLHCYAIPPGNALPAVLGAATMHAQTTAYVCLGTRCLPAAASLAELEQRLADLD